MYCQKCGQQVNEGTAFCPDCGAPIAAPESQNFKQETFKHSGPEAAQSQPQYQQPQQQPPFQQPPQYQQPAAPTGAKKSKVATAILAIFFGALGVHNFYLGFTKRAVIQLLISVLSFGIGAPVIAIWAFIEGIFYLTAHEGYTTDARGVPLDA